MWFTMFWAVPGAAAGRGWGGRSPAQHMGAPVSPLILQEEPHPVAIYATRSAVLDKLAHSPWVQVVVPR